MQKLRPPKTAQSAPPGSPGLRPGGFRTRYLSAENKFQRYLAAQDGTTPVGELLRREGLFSTYLARIRQQVREGLRWQIVDQRRIKKHSQRLRRREQNQKHRDSTEKIINQNNIPASLVA